MYQKLYSFPLGSFLFQLDDFIVNFPKNEGLVVLKFLRGHMRMFYEYFENNLERKPR